MKYIIILILILLLNSCDFKTNTYSRDDESIRILKTRVPPNYIAIFKDCDDWRVVYKDHTEKYFMRMYKYPELEEITQNQK